MEGSSEDVLQVIGSLTGLMQLENTGFPAHTSFCRSEREDVVTFEATHTVLPTCVRVNLQ